MSPSGEKTDPKTAGGQTAADAGRKGRVREYIEAFVVALLIALVVRTLVIQAFKIPSGSMENTLLVGDHIFVNKFIYGYHIPYTKGRLLEFRRPKEGDIIVFEFPEDPSKDFIKRVIGVPGDTVEIRHKKVYVNGLPLAEKYVRYADGAGAEAEGFPAPRDNMPSVNVPPGKLFVMGDNRDRSYDSRFWGFVDMDKVVGKALFIYFSVDWSRDIHWYEMWRWPGFVRWKRIGHVLE